MTVKIKLFEVLPCVNCTLCSDYFFLNVLRPRCHFGLMADSYLCHVGHPGSVSCGFFSCSQIFLANSETGIELSQANRVEWHLFQGTGAKNWGWTIF